MNRDPEDDNQHEKNSRTYYVDTNVLLSQYKPTDVFHRQSVIIVAALKRGEVIGYTSPLTILEMVSFVSRNFPLKKGETPEEARNIAISKILKEISSFRLHFSSPSGDYSLKLDSDRDVLMPAVLGNALGLSTVGLKTLDLIHLGAAKYCKETVAQLAGFVTGDSDFLEKKILSVKIGVPFLSPEELVRILSTA